MRNNFIFSDSSNFKELVKTIKTYNKDGGTEVGVVDFLEVVRPFCSDVSVSTELKSTVLHLLEEAFQLSGEDVFLLLYFQSEAIISSKWAIKVCCFACLSFIVLSEFCLDLLVFISCLHLRLANWCTARFYNHVKRNCYMLKGN